MQADHRRVAAALVDSAAGRALLSAFEWADAGREGRLVALTYHRIDEPDSRPWLLPAMVSVAPADFERQMSWLASRMRPISLEAVLAARRTGARLPRRAVLVTIDDAYEDATEQAWPILRRVGVPATLFVATAYPDSNVGYWWDRLHHGLTATRRDAIAIDGVRLPLESPGARRAAFAALHSAVRARPHDEGMALLARLLEDLEVDPPPTGIAGWRALRDAAAEGLTLAPHSRHHPRLDRIPLERGIDEVRGSIDDLRKRIGSAPPAFAYPSGDTGPPAVEAVARAGVELAFTTRRGGIEVESADWLRLRRINVGPRATLGLLRLQAGSWMRLVGR